MAILEIRREVDMARATILMFGSLVAAQAFAAPFAMITDLKGQAWALDGAQPRKLALLGYIENPTEIKLDPAGKLAITYFSNGVQYSFAGPARVALESGAPKVIDGAAGELKKVTPEKSIGGGLSSDQWRRLQQGNGGLGNRKEEVCGVGPRQNTR